MSNIVIVMSKVPIHGLIKTRLAKDIGYCLAKRLTLFNLDYLKKMFLHKKNIDLYFYITPANKFRTFSFSFCCQNILHQRGFTLGERIWYLKSYIKKSFVLVGSDIPEINLNHITGAFEALKTKDIVIGPTYDKGFWLIGFSNKKEIYNPFDNVRWSTDKVLNDLINNTKKYGINVGVIEKLRDIDIIDDYCDYRYRFSNR